MPLATQATLEDQLQGARGQISRGDTKEIAGVIDTGLYDDQDVLANQARVMARARGGIAMEAGAVIPDELINRLVVKTPERMVNMPISRSMNDETLNSLVTGALNREQQYTGNNADWTGYYLEPLAKYLQPFDMPFRNMLPRTAAPGIDQINWRAITSLFNGTGPDTTSFILNQGSSPSQQQYVWANFSNLLRQIARGDAITDESEIYGRLFEPDMRAKVVAKLAPSLMLGQETWYLNGAQKMWSPPPPNTGTTAASGGALSNATYWIAVTAKNFNGETLPWAVAPATSSVPGALSIAVTAGGSANTISFNIMRIPNNITGGSGAGNAQSSGWTYNVYIGTGSTQPANSAMWLQSASGFTNNTNTSLTGSHALDDAGGFSQGYFNVTLTGALATSGTALSSVSSNTAVVSSSGSGGTPASQSLLFDGLQSLAYVNAGALSTVGEGGETAVVKRVADAGGALAKSDIDGWLEAMYLNGRANPECILVGIKDHKAISNIVINATNLRVNVTPTQADLSNMAGGGRVTKWVNQTTGRLVDIVMCPYLTQGTIMAVSLTLPFSVPEIVEPPLRIGVNREMWAREYPPDQSHQTQWAFASFVNETMICQYLAGQGVLTGIVTA